MYIVEHIIHHFPYSSTTDRTKQQKPRVKSGVSRKAIWKNHANEIQISANGMRDDKIRSGGNLQ
jgi:hypothetical protein